MTRINTNVPSIRAQKTLGRSQADLQQALTRLSTGLRINTGKDDPAGLIASEILRSDIVGVQRGITNSQRANQMIATADSALGQVSRLLNDIRGLVSEAANSGAMSTEMIRANQLQIDSSLEAIDRIAQTTEFQGGSLLDGTLDFTTKEVDRDSITELRIDQANLGTQDELNVTIDVVATAEKARLNYPFGALAENAVLTIGGVDGYEAFTFDEGATIAEMAAAINLVSDATGVEAIVEKGDTKGKLLASSAGQNNNVMITAKEAGEQEGNVDIKYIQGHASGTSIEFDPSLSDTDPNTIVVEAQTRAYVSAFVRQLDDANLAVPQDNNALDITATIPGNLMNGTDVRIIDRTAIHPGSRADVTTPPAGLVEYNYDAVAAQMTLNGFNDAVTPYANDILLESTTGGSAYDDVTFEFINGGGGATLDVQYVTDANGAKSLQVTIDPGVTTLQDVVTAINNEGNFTATALTALGAPTPIPPATVIVAADCTGGGLPVTANTTNTGGDGGTIYMYVNDGVTTAANVIDAVQNPLNALYDDNARVRELFTIASSVDNDGTGLLRVNTHTDALTSGVTGGDVIATAEDVMNALNSTAKVQDLVEAEIAPGDTGLEPVTIFEEYAVYGDVQDYTGLQFLGPKGSRSVRFVSTPGTDLSVDFTTYPDQLANSTAELSSYNANASIRVQAVQKGEEYDDMVVRFKAAETGTIAQNVVTYDQRPSAAQAFLTFDTGAAALATNRNMIITAAEHGEWMNDVAIIMQIDMTLAAGTAAAAYDPDHKTLTISVRDDTDANAIITAVEDDADGDGEPDSGFHAELDYSHNAANNGTAIGFNTWVQAVGANDVATVANTGDTGGHMGGTLTVLVNPDVPADGTAANVISAINSDDFANKFFTAEAIFTGFDNGAIDFHNDTNKMITSGGVSEEGYMTVNLATGDDGLITTTAQNLVDYFDTLTAEQSMGVSVSLLQDDDDGNDGSGRLKATYPVPADLTTMPDGVSTDGSLEFASEGLELVEAAATGTTNARNGITAQITISAVRLGAEYDDIVVQFDDTIVDPLEDPTASYDETTKILTVNIHPTQTRAIQVVDAINQDLENFFTAAMADPTVPGAGNEFVTSDDTTTLAGGLVEQGTPHGAPFTGNADATETGLTIQSADYGSRAFVAVRALEGLFILNNPEGEVAERDTGEDIDLRLNSTQMVGNGRSATMNTATLDLGLTIAESVEVGDQLRFTITGGGAHFQMGPDVVSNQQARLGIQSINTTQLGGEDGKMFQLRTGGDADLLNNATKAFRIVENAIVEITSLRGRLGAFQRTTLETNIATLSDTLEALTSAESEIRDADFAKESAALTRSQILVQSGVSVLGIANQTPQSVLSLLRQ